MTSTLFNTNILNTNYSFKENSINFLQQKLKPTEIVYGMSINEISDVVSEKIMNIIRKQFEETANNHNTNEK